MSKDSVTKEPIMYRELHDDGLYLTTIDVTFSQMTKSTDTVKILKISALHRVQHILSYSMWPLFHFCLFTAVEFSMKLHQIRRMVSIIF